MTSSIRDGSQQDRDIREYKPHDPFEEPGLISILFLSCGKHALAKAALQSTAEGLRTYPGEVEWLFLEQEDDPEWDYQCEGLPNKTDGRENTAMYERFNVERKVIVRPNRNYGINNGFNQLWAVSRGQYCMIHENDWVNQDPGFPFMEHAKDILDEHSHIGLVQMRAVWDPTENWGLRKPEYSPWSCEAPALDAAGIKVWEETTSRGHEFLVSEFANGFNNNPNLMRKSLYRECGPYPEPPMTADPRHGETEYQERVAKTSCATAHINREVYVHMGGARKKEVVR